jgi:hypothetical protein
MTNDGVYQAWQTHKATYPALYGFIGDGIAFVGNESSQLFFMDGRPPHQLQAGETVLQLRIQYNLRAVFLNDEPDKPMSDAAHPSM